MNASRSNPSLICAFNILQIVGAITFGFITISAFIVQRQTRSRHATWFSFCFSWIVFCTSYALLTITGQQHHPNHGLCLGQTALVYAATPLAGATTVGICTHLLLNILSALSISPVKKVFSRVMTWVYIMPWALWIIVIVVSLVFGIQHPSSVQLSPNGTYCTLKGSNIAQMTSISAACVGAILIVEEGIVLYLLYRNREIFSSSGQSVTMAARVGVFAVTACVVVAIGLMFSLAPRVGGQFEILISTIPISTAIIFGSQKDLLKVWLFWKPRDTQDELAAVTPRDSVAFSTILSGISEEIPSTSHTTQSQQERV